GNYLRLPLGREVRVIDGRAAIADAIAFRGCYSRLPMVNNSAIQRSLLAELRGRTGRVFGNHYPDVYSGFALGFLARSYLSLDLPMTVAGLSGGSFGVATLFLRGKSPRDDEFRTLNDREGLPHHPSVPNLPIFPFVPVADSFQLAKEALFPADEKLQLDRRALATRYVHALRAADEVAWRAGLQAIRESFADDPESQDWFTATFGSHPFRPAPPVQLRSDILGNDGEFLHLDASAFGVSDVYGAVQLARRLLGFEGRPVRYGMKSCRRLEEAVQAEREAVGSEGVRLQAKLTAERGRAPRLRVELDAYRSRLSHRIADRIGGWWRRLRHAGERHNQAGSCPGAARVAGPGPFGIGTS